MVFQTRCSLEAKPGPWGGLCLGMSLELLLGWGICRAWRLSLEAERMW